MNTDALPRLSEFLKELELRDYSAETIYNYARDLRVLEHFLQTHDIAFENLRSSTIEEFKKYLFSENYVTPQKMLGQRRLSIGTANRILFSIRRYLSFLIDIEVPIPLIPNSVKLIKASKKPSQPINGDIFTELIESPSQFETIKELKLRNRAMLEMLFSTGMRVSELVSLNKDQIDRSGRVFIRGKGRKERFVYLTPRALKHIRQYLDLRHDDNPALFIPRRGRNAQRGRISTNYVQMKLKEYRERLGINIPTSPHSFRHGFATYLAEKGANPAAIQILLGHESLHTTTRYVHASDRYAEKTHRRFHPLK